MYNAKILTILASDSRFTPHRWNANNYPESLLRSESICSVGPPSLLLQSESQSYCTLLLGSAGSHSDFMAQGLFQV